jgi:hypothetical protein
MGTTANINPNITELQQMLVSYQKLAVSLHTFSEAPISNQETKLDNIHRCLQIVSRNLLNNLDEQCSIIPAMLSFLERDIQNAPAPLHSLEELQEKLEPLDAQYRFHRRLWLMFAECISKQKKTLIAAQ